MLKIVFGIIFCRHVYVLAVATKVKLKNGSPIIGEHLLDPASGKGLTRFLGIPYAEPPIEQLRFRPPVPHAPWVEEKSCKILPKACLQNIDIYFPKEFEGSEMWNPNTAVSEDCLYLNVWIPDAEAAKKSLTGLPVMVWMYGGGFWSGSSALKLYDGAVLATAENIIVVSFNYRLSSLGFLYLGQEDAPGNQGFLDQTIALQWVQSNIELFGGDPNRVTLFGESAGAGSVALHLVSRKSRGLLQGAIMQSGSIFAPWILRPPEKLLNSSLTFAAQVGCLDLSKTPNYADIITCLQALTEDAILSGEPVMKKMLDIDFGPMSDASFGFDNILQKFASRDINAKKVILGANSEEGNYFLIYFMPDLYDKVQIFQKSNFVHSQKGLNDAIARVMPANFFNNTAALVLTQHEYAQWGPNATPESRQKILDTVVGDYHFTCPVIEQAKQHYSAGNDVYLYHFTHHAKNNHWPNWTGAMHGYEIPFVFGLPIRLDSKYSEKEKMLSRRWMQYYANFARTGNPNYNYDGSKMTPFWPEFTIRDQVYLNMDEDINTGQTLRSQYCHFWKNYLPGLLNHFDANIMSLTEFDRDQVTYVALLPALLFHMSQPNSIGFGTSGQHSTPEGPCLKAAYIYLTHIESSYNHYRCLNQPDGTLVIQQARFEYGTPQDLERYPWFWLTDPAITYALFELERENLLAR